MSANTSENTDETEVHRMHKQDTLFWASDHEHYEGTEFQLMPIAGDDEEYCLNIVDVVEGKRLGQYGPMVIWD